jgi:hypothetical protein
MSTFSAKESLLVGRAVPRVALGMALVGLLVGAGGCANTNNRDEDTRGASLLILETFTTESGGHDESFDGAFLLSDVEFCEDVDGILVCSVYNDNGIARFRNEPLAPGAVTSFYQDITLTRYRVTYTRSDGFNTPGVDVPYTFDSVLQSTVLVNSTADVPFILVRHAAKEERPLIDLRGIGDEFVISTNTRVDFWGADLAGNNHSVHGWIDIEFADYGDE